MLRLLRELQRVVRFTLIEVWAERAVARAERKRASADRDLQRAAQVLGRVMRNESID